MKRGRYKKFDMHMNRLYRNKVLKKFFTCTFGSFKVEVANAMFIFLDLA